MTLEGFDAAMLIDVRQAPPLLLPAEPEDGPSLQDALAESVAATAPQLRLDRGATAPGDIDLPSLRPLSPDDMLLIAGGRGSEFTVMGPDPWDPTLPNDPDPDGPYGNGGGDGGGGETPGGSEGENPGGPFDDRVTIDPSMPPEQLERAQQAELQLQAQMSQLDAKIQSLPDNALLTIGDKTYTGAEIKALWAGVEVVITWEGNYGPMGQAMNFDGIIRINLPALENRIANYGSSTEWGVDDFLIHELSHLLPADREYLQSQWASYRDSGGSLDINSWQQSSYFQNAESYTHSWQRAIGGAIGIPGYSPQSPPDTGGDDSELPSPL
jgi:hypothetical protein